MIVVAGTSGVWHCPDDGVGYGTPSVFGLGGFIKLYTRAPDVTTYFYGDDDDWGLTASLSYVTVNFTVADDSVDITFYVETDLDSDMGSVGPNTYAPGSYTVTIPCSPVADEHLQKLHLQLAASGALVTIVSLATDGCGSGGSGGAGGPINYPDDLPGPWVATITAANRRAATEPRGPLRLRPLQRHRLYTQQLEWVLKPAQAATFKSWLDDDLTLGAAWFFARWPHPLGRTGRTERRFIDYPTWTHMPGGNWRVAVECEVREVGLPVNSSKRDIDRIFYRISNHDWGIIDTDFIYTSAYVAAGAAQLAYEAVWNKPHGQPPPEGRGTYFVSPADPFIIHPGDSPSNFPGAYTYYVYRLRADDGSAFDVGAVIGRTVVKT